MIDLEVKNNWVDPKTGTNRLRLTLTVDVEQLQDLTALNDNYKEQFYDSFAAVLANYDYPDTLWNPKLTHFFTRDEQIKVINYMDKHDIINVNDWCKIMGADNHVYSNIPGLECEKLGYRISFADEEIRDKFFDVLKPMDDDSTLPNG
jgi:hypothetical protein